MIGIPSSCPGLSRASTSSFKLYRQDVDGRGKPRHDDLIVVRAQSVDRSDQGLDLIRMRTEVLGELVQIGIGDLLKAGLVDIGDDLDAHFLELRRGGTL